MDGKRCFKGKLDCKMYEIHSWDKKILEIRKGLRQINRILKECPKIKKH